MKDEKTEEEINAEKEKIEKYNKLKEFLFKNYKNKNYDKSVFDMLTKLLKINPECYPMWNYRKELINNINDDIEKQKIMKSELLFNQSVIAEKNPKCYSVWYHRYWILEQYNLKYYLEDMVIQKKN